MARLPDYTAQIGIQPPGVVQVPVNDAVGRALQGAGNTVQNAGDEMFRVAEHAAKLDYQKSVSQASTNLDLYTQQRKTAYDEAVQNAPANGENFHSTWMQSQAEADQKFMATVPAGLQDRMRQQLAIQNEAWSNQSADTERKVGSAYYLNSAKESYTAAQNAARNDPDSRDTVQQGLFQRVDDLPYVSKVDKELLKSSWKNGLEISELNGRFSADPVGLTNAAGRQSSAPVKVPSAQVGASITKAAAAIGTTPQDLATVISYESGFSTSKWGGKGGNYMGLIQFGPEERKKYGVHPGQSFDEQMGSVVAFLKDRGFKPGMGLLDLYSTINAGSPGHYDASDGNGTVRSHVAKMQAANAGRAGAILAGTADDVDINAGGGKGGGTAPDPRYSSVTPDQWDSLIEGAQRNLNGQQTEAAKQQKAAIDGAVNTLQNGIIVGTVGMSDVNAARKSWLTDADTANKLIDAINKRDKDTITAGQFWQGAKDSGGAMNPFDPNVKKGADAAFIQEGGNIDALNKVYNAGGVMPPSGVVALRGGMISQNVPQRQAALTIAQNALSRDPNVFTASDGGAEIEQQAARYKHLVNDIGMPADKATQQIIAENVPEALAKSKQSDTSVAEFTKTIDPDVVRKQFNTGWTGGTSLTGTPVLPQSPTQQAAMMSEFRELAGENFKQYGDENQAIQYATQQLNKVWGVTDVFGLHQLTKFPVEKTYPPVTNDPNGPYAYIKSQALDVIRERTGVLVTPDNSAFGTGTGDNIVLAPVEGGASAQAFYKGQPVPYTVGYMAPNEAGYMVLHTLPGGPVTFDIEKGHRLANQQAGPAIDAMSAKDRVKQETLQQEQDFNQQRYNTMNPSSAPPNRREWPGPPPPKIMPSPVPQPIPGAGKTPTSGSDAFQSTKDQFQTPTGGDGFGGSGVGM